MATFFYGMLFLLFWGFNLHKTWQKVVTFAHTAFPALRLCHSGIANEKKTKTKDVQGQGPSNINPSLFASLMNVYRPVWLFHRDKEDWP